MNTWAQLQVAAVSAPIVGLSAPTTNTPETLLPAYWFGTHDPLCGFALTLAWAQSLQEVACLHVVTVSEYLFHFELC